MNDEHDNVAPDKSIIAEIVTQDRPSKKYKATITVEIEFTIYLNEDPVWPVVDQEAIEYLLVDGGDDYEMILDDTRTTSCTWEEIV